MEALIATSRAISNDKVLERENQRKYSQHIKKVCDISSHKVNPILSQVRQSQRMAQTLYRSKSSAKAFQTNEKVAEIKRDNRLMVQKIRNMDSNIKFDQNNHLTLQHISGSNWSSKKIRANLITEENKRISKNLACLRMDPKEYKKKIEQEIKQYLDLKKQIRKCNYSSQKSERSKTERKKFNLKLKGGSTEQQAEQSNKDSRLNQQKCAEEDRMSHKDKKIPQDEATASLDKQEPEKGKQTQKQSV